jgi:hypothetical protein
VRVDPGLVVCTFAAANPVTTRQATRKKPCVLRCLPFMELPLSI